MTFHGRVFQRRTLAGTTSPFALLTEPCGPPEGPSTVARFSQQSGSRRPRGVPGTSAPATLQRLVWAEGPRITMPTARAAGAAALALSLPLAFLLAAYASRRWQRRGKITKQHTEAAAPKAGGADGVPPPAAPSSSMASSSQDDQSFSWKSNARKSVIAARNSSLSRLHFAALQQQASGAQQVG